MLIHGWRPLAGGRMGKLLLSRERFPEMIHFEASESRAKRQRKDKKRLGVLPRGEEVPLENSRTSCSFAKCLRIELTVKRLYLSTTSFPVINPRGFNVSLFHNEPRQVIKIELSVASRAITS